ncbi:hypothetical protein NJBCHELONAE_01900 [Mycobacteroides chelonae]|uniref:ATP-binding protein n=1 Tax=Mycobacteroides chelonae TaxID=1774 RepID=UPI0021DF0240|nr:ATP-binding protein [Mycobacteroides chelonae]GLE54879.1 hypothetical protein NJBCHELONAE_01900 [Mycobacteroides chelonae]
MSNTTTHTLGFYDPLTYRSVVGYADDGSPIWLTWRDAPAVALAGVPGAGKTHLLTALARGMREHVDVSVIDGKAGLCWDALADDLTEFDATGDVDIATRIVRDIVHSFAAEPPSRPKVLIVDEPSSFHPSNSDQPTDEFWNLLRHIAMRGRRHHTTVLLSTQRGLTLPSWFLDNATVTLALPMVELDALRFAESLREHIATDPGEFTSRRLAIHDQRSGVAVGSTREPAAVHSPSCDCVERATALLTKHAVHSAA